MWKVKTSLNKGGCDARNWFIWAEKDFIQIRYHLKRLADNEHDRDCDEHDAKLVLLPLLLKTTDFVWLIAWAAVNHNLRNIHSWLSSWSSASNTAKTLYFMFGFLCLQQHPWLAPFLTFMYRFWQSPKLSLLLFF